MPDELQAESTDIQRSQDIMNYISISDYYYATQKLWRRAVRGELWDPTK